MDTLKSLKHIEQELENICEDLNRKERIYREEQEERTKPSADPCWTKPSTTMDPSSRQDMQMTKINKATLAIKTMMSIEYNMELPSRELLDRYAEELDTVLHGKDQAIRKRVIRKALDEYLPMVKYRLIDPSQEDERRAELAGMLEIKSKIFE